MKIESGLVLTNWDMCSSQRQRQKGKSKFVCGQKESRSITIVKCQGQRVDQDKAFWHRQRHETEMTLLADLLWDGSNFRSSRDPKIILKTYQGWISLSDQESTELDVKVQVV